MLELSENPNHNIPSSKVGIIIPTFNEEKNIYEVLSQLKNLGYYNILVVDGNSIDNTVQVSRQLGANVVMQTGKGKGDAIRQALRDNYIDTDIVVLMDADGSMSPNEIPYFIEAICKGADIAKGSRFLKNGGTYDMTRLRKFGNFTMVYIANLLHSLKYTDICYGFVALNKKAKGLLAKNLESNGFDIEAEMFIKAYRVGLDVVEVPSVEYLRKYGESNLHSFRDGLKIFQKIFSLALYQDKKTVH